MWKVVNYILGKWEEADGAIKEAAEKDPNFADTLINQVVVSSLYPSVICSILENSLIIFYLFECIFFYKNKKNIQVATQTGNQDVARRTLASLRGSCAQHPFVKDLENKEAEIDRLIKQYLPVN